MAFSLDHEDNAAKEALPRLEVDPGRVGEKTIFTLRCGPVVMRRTSRRLKDGVAITRATLMLAQAWSVNTVVVDIAGIGASVYDCL